MKQLMIIWTHTYGYMLHLFNSLLNYKMFIRIVRCVSGMALPDPLRIKWTGRIKYFREKKHIELCIGYKHEFGYFDSLRGLKILGYPAQQLKLTVTSFYEDPFHSSCQPCQS